MGIPILFIQLSIIRHWDHCHFVAIANGVTMNTSVQIFLDVSAFSYLGINSDVELLD